MSSSEGGGWFSWLLPQERDRPGWKQKQKESVGDSSSSQTGLPQAPRLMQSHAGSSDGETAAKPSIRKLMLVEVQPLHVVAVSLGVVAAGTVATGVATYRSGKKGLIEDGINPDLRLKIIPVALKTLGLSMLLTGMLGVAGFVALKQSGILTADRAELPSATEAARLIRSPRAFMQELLGGDPAKVQQQAEASVQSSTPRA